jgi:hypothetical protein
LLLKLPNPELAKVREPYSRNDLEKRGWLRMHAKKREQF